MQSDRLEEPARCIPVVDSVDVCVVGGGSAGVAAAVSAARCGRTVALLERHGFLGGTLTAVTLGSICGLYAVTEESIRQIVGGLAAEIVERLKRHDGAGEPRRWLKTASLPYDVFALKRALDEFVLEAGVRLHFYSPVLDVVQSAGRITHVISQGKAGRWALKVGQIIDCSGDADVAVMVGASTELNLADLQLPTAMFRLGGVAPNVLDTIDRNELQRCLEQAVAAGYDLPRTAGGIFSERPGVVHLNITKVKEQGRAPNPFNVAELTRAEVEGRRQVALYEKAFRSYVPGFADSYVLDTGAVLGIRESRRLIGRYALSGDDVLSGARFDDAIACCAWPMEDHSGGQATRWVWLEPGRYYQIPMRCLIPDTVENLVVAGRCASATHNAQASFRVSAQCFAMGEAAGVLASHAFERAIAVAHVDARTVRERLANTGAFLGD